MSRGNKVYDTTYYIMYREETVAFPRGKLPIWGLLGGEMQFLAVRMAELADKLPVMPKRFLFGTAFVE